MFNTKRKIREIRRKWGARIIGNDPDPSNGTAQSSNTDSGSEIQAAPSTNWWMVAGVALITTSIVGAGAWGLGYLPQNLIGQSSQSSTDLRIKGNKRSRIYHLPNCPNYNDIAENNIVWFRTHEEAKKAGFRMAKNC